MPIGSSIWFVSVFPVGNKRGERFFRLLEVNNTKRESRVRNHSLSRKNATFGGHGDVSFHCAHHSVSSLSVCLYRGRNDMLSVAFSCCVSAQNINCKLEGCLTVHLPHEIKWNANLMQQGNFTDVFLARHVSGTYAHHQEH